MIPKIDQTYDFKLSQSQKDTIVSGLQADGYFHLPGVLKLNLARGLAAAARGDQANFRPARIGKSPAQMESIRSDQIRWWTENEDHPARQNLLELLNDLKTELNRRLLLGLWDFEMHDAVYRHGQSYQRHIDAFQRDNLRVLSFVLYLNENWEEKHGGTLLLHPQGRNSIMISPTIGTLVG